MTSFRITTFLIFLIIAVVLIYFCIWSEKSSQDCKDINHPCINSTPVVNINDSTIEAIEKIIETNRKNFNSVGWRRSMIVALIATLIILILALIGSFDPLERLLGFLPNEKVNGVRIFLIVVLIFTLVYLSTVYLQNCWWAPKCQQVEDQLMSLQLSLSKKDNKSNRADRPSNKPNRADRPNYKNRNKHYHNR